MNLPALKRLDWQVTSRLRRLIEPAPGGPAGAAEGEGDADALNAAAGELGERRAPGGRRLLRLALVAAARSADSLVLVPLLLGIWWLEGFSRRGLAFPLGVAFMLSLVFTAALKLAFRRRRPPGEWGALYRRTDPHSFPSGHASRTAALGVAAWAFQGWGLGLGLVIWSVLVSLARVVLGVHYSLDIAVGYLLGLLIGAAVWAARGLIF